RHELNQVRCRREGRIWLCLRCPPNGSASWFGRNHTLGTGIRTTTNRCHRCCGRRNSVFPYPGRRGKAVQACQRQKRNDCSSCRPPGLPFYERSLEPFGSNLCPDKIGAVRQLMQREGFREISPGGIIPPKFDMALTFEIE